MPCSFKAPAYWGNFIPAHWQKGCLFTWQYDGLLPTKSQAGQDLVILALSPLTENPLFLDVGANDGITGNSSLLLEQKGWKGLLVEPNISLLSSLLEFRASPVLVGAVASENGILNLATSNIHTLGTCLVDENSPEIQRLLHESGGACNIVYMPSASFTLEMIYSYFIKSFSFPPAFLKLDIEGLEYSVLASPPPLELTTLIEVENNARDSRVASILEARGYELLVVMDSFIEIWGRGIFSLDRLIKIFA